MTADVPVTGAAAAPSRLVLPSYGRPRDVHPPLDYSGYRSTALRHPKQPLVLLPQRLTEITGPLLGDELITPTDGDLTMQHDGEPQGQRIIRFSSMPEVLRATLERPEGAPVVALGTSNDEAPGEITAAVQAHLKPLR